MKSRNDSLEHLLATAASLPGLLSLKLAAMGDGGFELGRVSTAL